MYNYAIHRIWHHSFYLLYSRLIVNCMCNVTHTNCKPILICHSLCKNNWALWISNVVITATYEVFVHLILNHR